MSSEDAPQMSEVTAGALVDPGWISACMLVMEVGNQVFGPGATIEAVPDPDGTFQKAAGKAGDKVGVFVTISSLRVPGLEASLVMPFEVDAISEIRLVMVEMALKLRSAEEQQMNPAAKLLVPNKGGLIVPGRE